MAGNKAPDLGELLYQDRGAFPVRQLLLTPVLMIVPSLVAQVWMIAIDGYDERRATETLVIANLFILAMVLVVTWRSFNVYQHGVKRYFRLVGPRLPTCLIRYDELRAPSVQVVRNVNTARKLYDCSYKLVQADPWMDATGNKWVYGPGIALRTMRLP